MIYLFTKFGRIVDVGGGKGMLLARVLAAHPQGRGVLYDRSSVVQDVTDEIAALTSAGRCEVMAGDFFDRVPEGANAYLLSQIIHDWEDEKALRILRNCRRAVAADSVVLLIERLLDLENGAIPSTIFSPTSKCLFCTAQPNDRRRNIGRCWTRAVFASSALSAHRRRSP